MKKTLRAQNAQQLDSLLASFAQTVADVALGRARPPASWYHSRSPAKPPSTNPSDLIAGPLTDYILRTGKPATGDSTKDQLIWATIANRLNALIEARETIAIGNPPDVAAFKEKIAAVRRGDGIDSTLRSEVVEYARLIVSCVIYPAGPPADNLQPLPPKIEITKVNFARFRRCITSLYSSALPDDVKILDDLLGLNDQGRQITQQVAANNAKAEEDITRFFSINLPSVRTPKQIYPIAPRVERLPAGGKPLSPGQRRPGGVAGQASSRHRDP